MALFRRQKQNEEATPQSSAQPLVERVAYCRTCRAEAHFSRCWQRVGYLTQCTCCGLDFSDPKALYNMHQPACPHCGEFLEHPGFEYGLCDTCGSKYEFVEGAVPGWLPNQKQRQAMNRYGQSRSSR